MASTSPVPVTTGRKHAPRFTIEPVTQESAPTTIDAARKLLLEYGRFVASQAGVAGFCYGTLKQEAAALPASYGSQQGNAGALIARLAAPSGKSSPWVGFVAWRTLPAPELADAWEIKRLWVRPAGRGAGIGRALIESILQRAKAAGKSRLLLDTAPDSMAAAHKLYLDLGFTPCAPYTPRPTPGIIYLQKPL